MVSRYKCLRFKSCTFFTKWKHNQTEIICSTNDLILKVSNISTCANNFEFNLTSNRPLELKLNSLLNQFDLSTFVGIDKMLAYKRCVKENNIFYRQMIASPLTFNKSTDVPFHWQMLRITFSFISPCSWWSENISFQPLAPNISKSISAKYLQNLTQKHLLCSPFRVLSG